MGRAFTIETARKIVEDEVGIPARLDEDDHKPEVEAATEDMLFAQLAFRLNSAAQWWGWKERLQTSATPRMRAEIADRVAAKCAGLLATMKGPDGELISSLGSGGLWAQAANEGAESGRVAVAEALDAVSNLQRWAITMSDRDKRDKRDNRAESTVTRRPDEAFDEFLATLGSIFWQFWRRPPARSRESLRGALREDRSSASLQPCCTNWTTLDLMKQ